MKHTDQNSYARRVPVFWQHVSRYKWSAFIMLLIAFANVVNVVVPLSINGFRSPLRELSSGSERSPHSWSDDHDRCWALNEWLCWRQLLITWFQPRISLEQTSLVSAHTFVSILREQFCRISREKVSTRRALRILPIKSSFTFVPLMIALIGNLVVLLPAQRFILVWVVFSFP